MSLYILIGIASTAASLFFSHLYAYGRGVDEGMRRAWQRGHTS